MPSLDKVLVDLTAREPIFHRSEFGTTRADFAAMTAEDFWEIGASGRIYTRQYVLDELDKRHASPHEDIWEASGFACRVLSHDTYLLTYNLVQNNTRHTRRTTVWRSTPDGWKILFHQGTLVQPE